MGNYLPYLVSILCAAIAGIASYAVARKQAKADIQRLEKVHELNIEAERERHKSELEKIMLEHKHKVELLEKEYENQLSGSMLTTMMPEIMKMPEVKREISKGMREKKK